MGAGGIFSLESLASDLLLWELGEPVVGAGGTAGGRRGQGNPRSRPILPLLLKS